LLTGTIFVEKIYDIHGLGLAGLDAERRIDLPMLSAVILIGAALIVLANLAVDVLYSLIDPRVRLS
jgi:peptide/nickel transport system permease protein